MWLLSSLKIYLPNEDHPGANSKPEFSWFLEDSIATTDYDQNYVNCSENDFYIEETITSDEGWITKFKANFLESDDGLSQIIKFKANILDSGCRLICQILLLDDKQNEVTLPPIISAAVWKLGLQVGKGFVSIAWSRSLLFGW